MTGPQVVPYVLMRLPLTLIDRTLVRRLPAQCRRRTVFDHGLGVADHWAGLILGDERIADSGRLRVAHAGRYSGASSAVAGDRGLLALKAHASVRAAIRPAQVEGAP
jgi:hypothetical protein